jgi:hypothetical protein
MRKAMLSALCAIAVFGGAMAADIGYRKFDGMLPGTEPQLFAPDVFVADKSYIGYQSLRGDAFLYAVTDREWMSSALYIRVADKPFEARRLDLLHSSWEGEPFISADGKRLYFTAILPPGDKPWHSDLYVAMRQGEGWGAAKPLPAPVNTAASEWHVSLTAKDVLYFCSERDGGRLKGDIFRAVPVGGSYRVEKLPDTVNTAANDCDPLIAPDESWLIFHSDRPGGFGAHDLYISFRDHAGHWSQAVNMGPRINTSAWEMAPSLTPDGKYLMFVRRKAFVTAEPSRIWWVSAAIIEGYRTKAK